MKPWLASVLLVACSPTRTSALHPPSSASAATNTWSATSWEDRHDTMTFLVLPEMARAFQQFEGKPYPDLTCLSCHGADAEKNHYRMPSGSPLDPARLSPKDNPDRHDARVVAFMTDRVTPLLAEMLGKPDVGCFTCHVRKGGV